MPELEKLFLLHCRHYYANQAGIVGNATKECSNPGIFNEMNATKYAATTKWNAPWFVGEYGLAPSGCLKIPGVRLGLSNPLIWVSDRGLTAFDPSCRLVITSNG